MSQPPEAAILPDLPVIDAHMHLWDGYLAPEFLADLACGHRVEASVYIECGMGYADDPRPGMACVGEMAHVRAQVAAAPGGAHRLAAAVMGGADLRLGRAAGPVIDALSAASEGRLRGVRYRAAADPDPVAGYGERGRTAGEALDDPAFVEGARCLARRGLVLDLWAFHPQLPRVVALARALPELAIVLEHLGGPLGVGPYAAHRAAAFADWARSIERLAACPNVILKASGLGISRVGFGFQTDGPLGSRDLELLWRPYVEHGYAAFGPARTMFSSNFPVDRAAGAYGTVLNAYKRLFAHLSDPALEAVFAGTARRLYRL